MSDSTPDYPPYIDGPAHAEVLFFIQGWPDDHTLWDDLVAQLGDRYRCVRVDLTNYAGAEQRRWGRSHEDIVAALAACVRRVSPDRPVTLIAHDWGAYWGYRLHREHPTLVARIVGLDIAPHMKPKLYEVPMILAYQWWLTAAFVAGGPIGNGMTRIFATVAQAPKRREVRASFNYPYFYTWRDILRGRAAATFRGYWPELPIFFAFGKKKPAQFHSERWLQHVLGRPGNVVLPLEHAGHWVMQDPQLGRELGAWLDASTPAVRARA